MVAPRNYDPKAKGQLLSLILRGLRLFRRRLSADVATSMNMPPRSYEHFEAGKGRLNVARVHLFAKVLSVDPYGIFAALEIGSPAFAARTADNNFMTVFHIALQEFDATTQDAIANLDAYDLMDAFNEMFDKLSAAAAAKNGVIKRWRRDTDEDPEDGEDA